MEHEEPQVASPQLPLPAPMPPQTGETQSPAPGAAVDTPVDLQKAATAYAHYGSDAQKDAGVEVDQRAPVDPHAIKNQYSAQAYEMLGIDEKTFNEMNPIQRNGLITRYYAQMYTHDPESLKWAGMASYASSAIGLGMVKAPAGDAFGTDGKKLQQVLGQGNGELWQHMGWQNMAFEKGGIDAIRQAAKSGDIPADELAAWEKIAAAKQQLQDAKGDQTKIDAARAASWEGNAEMLRYEQQTFLQQHVYDPNRALMKDATSFVDLEHPFSGMDNFTSNDRDDIGDVNQRWDWITKSMLPVWKQKATNDPGGVQEDMRRFAKGPPNPEGGAPVWTIDDPKW